jgi:flavin-dependent dehydrogenase
MKQKLHEAIVIGGGPAGCAAAITLAQAGRPVCLLERKALPHDKVCGEFISYDAAKSLTDLGVDLRSLGAQSIRELALYTGEKSLECKLPFPAWALSRRELDARLLEKSREAGVQVNTGMAVRNLHHSNPYWDLMVTSHNEPNVFHQLDLLQARTLFLATGKHEIQDWKRREGDSANNELIGLKMHLHLDPQQMGELKGRVEVYFYNGGYAGLLPIEDGKANLCLLVKRNLYKLCGGDWNRMLSELCKTVPPLTRRLSEARSLWPKPLAIAGVPYGYIQPAASVKPQLFRVGDQSAVIHSLAGDGIAIALQSGIFSAQSYLAGESAGFYQLQSQQTYQPPIRQAQWLAKLLATSAGRDILFAIAQRWPGLMPKVISHFRLKENSFAKAG